MKIQVCFSDYVSEIYETMVNTPRSELEEIQNELSGRVPEPLHSAFEEKEGVTEAKIKHNDRKSKQTPICPATCTGNRTVSFSDLSCFIFIWNVTCYFRCTTKGNP